MGAPSKPRDPTGSCRRPTRTHCWQHWPSNRRPGWPARANNSANSWSSTWTGKVWPRKERTSPSSRVRFHVSRLTASTSRPRSLRPCPRPTGWPTRISRCTNRRPSRPAAWYLTDSTTAMESCKMAAAAAKRAYRRSPTKNLKLPERSALRCTEATSGRSKAPFW
uniref:(northern house mosquito) hypothetical protein n=1 Tax=Culex pipiens TaxID=7175 RepID=A0A8D8A641_CULPI